MTKPIDTGGPANPLKVVREFGDFDEHGGIKKSELEWESYPGMTWLDYAAIQIAASIISDANNNIAPNWEKVATHSFACAQALLARKREIEKGEA